MILRIVWLSAFAAATAGLAAVISALFFIPVERWEEFIPIAATVVVGLVVVVSFIAQRVGDSLAESLREVLHAIEQGGASVAELDARHAPGEVAPLLSALRRARGRLLTTMEQLERDRAQVATIFEHMADGVVVFDARERVVLSNPAARRLLRQPRLDDRRLAEVMRDPDLVEVARAATPTAPVVQVVELRQQSSHGRVWLQVISTRLPESHQTLVLLQDVTDLRRAEAARRDFVANISHELRTPIASLKALAETLEFGAIDEPEAAREFLGRIHVEVDGLAHLVSELLDLARVEAGRLALNLEPEPAFELVGTAVQRVQAYAERLGLTVRVAAEVTDAEVLADRQRIGQVLANLLNNAVKFTPAGGTIEVGARPRTDAVEFWVADTGTGIESDELTRVFERFYKTDPSRHSSGTGLGLAICKHFVIAHGGSIWAESAGPGRGSTFHFILPTRSANTHALPAPEAPSRAAA